MSAITKHPLLSSILISMLTSSFRDLMGTFISLDMLLATHSWLLPSVKSSLDHIVVDYHIHIVCRFFVPFLDGQNFGPNSNKCKCPSVKLMEPMLTSSATGFSAKSNKN